MTSETNDDYEQTKFLPTPNQEPGAAKLPKLDPEHHMEFTIGIDIDEVSDDKEFYERDNIERVEKESEEIWETMDSQSRKALLAIIRESLLRIAGYTGKWVPYSMVVDSNRTWQIVITIKTSEIEDIVMALQRKAEVKAQGLRDEAEEIAVELSE